MLTSKGGEKLILTELYYDGPDGRMGAGDVEEIQINFTLMHNSLSLREILLRENYTCIFLTITNIITMKKFEKLSISKFHSLEVKEIGDVRGGAASILGLYYTSAAQPLDADELDQ